MNSLNSLLDHVGGLPAKTVQTSAHRLHLGFSRLGKRNVATEPTKFLISDPSLLSTRRSDPYLGLASAMSDRQRPLGVELNYIGVRNDDSAQGIYNFDVIISQNHFGFNPDQVCSSYQKQADQKFEDVLFKACSHNHTVRSKEKDQYKRHTRPSKVASRSKGFIHFTSIAGETK